MRIIELIRSVMLSVAHNKFRIFLTSLGIIIGTFTIIMVVGIGNASEAAVAEQFKRLSVESITISQSRGGPADFARGPAGQTKSITKDEMLLMPDLLQDVKSVGIMTRTNSDIAYSSESASVGIQGINEAYAEITNLSVLQGDFFTDADGATRNRVVVLGNNLAKTLFGENIDTAVGETVIIKGTTFKVVGILNRIGGSGGISAAGDMASSVSADDIAFIPYDVALKYTTGNAGARGGPMMGGGSATYIALANDMQSVKPAIDEIKTYIDGITGTADSYNVVDAGSALTSAQATSKTMSTLLIAVAAIVLFVSGIGIMNVLMVAVKERTREIGILKSIGAARRVILLEFLFEAIFISLCGGILGVMLSVLVPWILSFTDIKYLASVDGIALGLGFSVATGIFFGYYPAAKASKLKPIDALNYD